MAGAVLKGLKVAILVANGFEQVEFTSPKAALEQAGAQTVVISPEKGKVQGWHHDVKADQFTVDLLLDDANPNDYDGLVLPGGVFNPDVLRLNPKAVEFVKSFVQTGKPIAAICHGPWTLINAEGVRGKTMTSWPSLEADLNNAGAHWVDKMVVRDGNLVTSRKPDDLPAFNKEIIPMFEEALKKKNKS